jgi:hypothetical protein
MTDATSECRRTWRRLGVAKHVADEMAVDLEADIASAAAEGFSVASVVGHDVRGFATEWATARGVVRPRLRLALTASAAVIGAIPGVAGGLFVAYGLSSDAMGELFGAGHYRVGNMMFQSALSVPEWLLLLLYGIASLFAYAGAVAAVAATLYWRLDPALHGTVRLLALALPGAIALAVAATVAFAATRDFSTSTRVVGADIVVATFVLGASVAALRYGAVRRERGLVSAAV